MNIGNGFRYGFPITLAVLVLVWVVQTFVTPVVAPPVFSVNGVLSTNTSALVALTNTVNSITSGRYDSFQSPRGSYYQVPSGLTLVITHLEGEVDKGAGLERVTIGYASGTVSDDVSAPAGATVVFNATLESGVNGPGFPHVDTYIPIPAGSYIFLNVDGGGAIQATGVLVRANGG